MARRELKRREVMLIGVGVAILLVAGLIPMARNFSRKYDRAQDQLEQARVRLTQTRELRGAIEEERRGHNAVTERIRARDARFDLYSFTNKCLRDLDLHNRAALQSRGSMFSGGSLDGVQITLRGVSMEELVNLLHTLYDSANLIALQRLNHLRASRDGDGLDCQMTLMAPKS